MSTHVEADPKILRTKGLKANALFALRAYSFYDKKNNQRKISRKDASNRQLASLAKDLNKDNVGKSLNILKSKNIIKEEGEYYILNEIDGAYFNIDTDFLKELLYKRNSDYVNIYLWLRNRFFYRCKEGRPAYFSIKDILEHVFQYKTRDMRVYNRIKNILADIVADGLITYKIMRVNENLYLREIFAIREEFVIAEAAKKQDDQVFIDASKEKSTDNIGEASEAQEVATVGFDLNKISRIDNDTGKLEYVEIQRIKDYILDYINEDGKQKLVNSIEKTPDNQKALAAAGLLSILANYGWEM